MTQTTAGELATKACSKCGEEKPVGAFHHRARSRDGRQAWCKQCVRRYADSRAPEIKERVAQWAAENSDRIREVKRRWWASNRQSALGRMIENGHVQREEMSDSYIAQLLDIPVDQLRQSAPELFDLQRASLQLRRARRELKKTLEKMNEQHHV